jgi:hypothetical protein
LAIEVQSSCSTLGAFKIDKAISSIASFCH